MYRNDRATCSKRASADSKPVRLDNLAIQYHKAANLQAGEYYVGRISDSYALQSSKGMTLKILIDLEDGSGEFESS